MTMMIKNNGTNDMVTENAVLVQHPDYKAEVIEILRSNLAPKLKQEKLSTYHENDIAAALDLLNRDERGRLYRILDIDTLASVLEYSENMNSYINELSIKTRVKVLLLFEPSVTVDYLRQLEKNERTILLDLMDEDTKREISLLSSFDEDEIGSRMSTNYIAIQADTNIRQAMHSLIEQAAENDNISTLYVVDDENTYLGAIDLKELIIARKDVVLASITMTSYPYVYANEQIERLYQPSGRLF